MKQKQAEKITDRLFNELGANIQFNVMDLNKIAGPVESLLLAGGTEQAAREAMQSGINTYRRN